MKGRKRPVTELIHDRIKEKGEGYWRLSDFSDLPHPAVSKTFSRLAAKGDLKRISKGLYYRPKMTRFGESHPSQFDIQKLYDKAKLHPAGITAANLLGFSTQNAIHGVFATSASSVPRAIIGSRAQIHTRRPETWNDLEPIDAALLDFIRSGGEFSELSNFETTKMLLDYFREADRFKRLAGIADKEPPRVRAILGAIGEELKKDSKVIKRLRNELNPISRFDFGKLSCLRFAKEWQAK